MPDSADCRTEVRPYGGMCPPFQDPSAIPMHPALPQSVDSHQGLLYQSCGRPQGWSFGHCLVSEQTQRTDSFLTRQENFISRNLLQIQSILLARDQLSLSKLGTTCSTLRSLGITLSYPKGDRDGMIKDCVHNHLLLSKSSHIPKWKEIVLCINLYKQPQMWLFWIQYSAKEYRKECATVAESQFPLSPCLAFAFAAGTCTGLYPGSVPALLLSHQDPRAVSLVGEKAVQSVHLQHCHINFLHWDLHCHSPNLSSFTFTVKVSNSDSV